MNLTFAAIDIGLDVATIVVVVGVFLSWNISRLKEQKRSQEERLKHQDVIAQKERDKTLSILTKALNPIFQDIVILRNLFNESSAKKVMEELIDSDEIQEKWNSGELSDDEVQQLLIDASREENFKELIRFSNSFADFGEKLNTIFFELVASKLDNNLLEITSNALKDYNVIKVNYENIQFGICPKEEAVELINFIRDMQIKFIYDVLKELHGEDKSRAYTQNIFLTTLGEIDLDDILKSYNKIKPTIVGSYEAYKEASKEPSHGHSYKSKMGRG